VKKIADPLGLFLKDKPKNQSSDVPGINTQADKPTRRTQPRPRSAGARRRSGRASTIFTSALGDTSTPNTWRPARFCWAMANGFPNDDPRVPTILKRFAIAQAERGTFEIQWEEIAQRVLPSYAVRSPATAC
jgi:hypothetical protein